MTSGIVMGIKNGKVLIQHEKSKIANRNQYVVGGPGSFKTQSFIITNMLNITDCSLVVTDPKGEVYEKTAKIKEAQGYEVRVVNFKNMGISIVTIHSGTCGRIYMLLQLLTRLSAQRMTRKEKIFGLTRN